METIQRARRQFTPEFKNSAVRLVENRGRETTAIAKDLDVPMVYLYR